MTLGRLAQVGIGAVWLMILLWEILGGITSQPCVLEGEIAFHEVRAVCVDGVTREGRLNTSGGRNQRRLVVGDVVRHSVVWGGFRRDGVFAGYGFSLYSAFFLLPIGYLAEKMLRPPGSS